MNKVRILIDGDACPVRYEITRLARRFGVEVVLFANSSQDIVSDEVQVVRVSDRRDAADFAIVSGSAPDDIVVTDDIGLAAMVMGKCWAVLSSKGTLFRPQQMEGLLQFRHVARKIRQSGGRTPGPRPLTKADRAAFSKALEVLLKRRVKGK